MIHVYHESADYLVHLIKRAAPARPVIALKSPHALAQALPEIEVLFAPTPPREGWAAATKLRLVQLLGVGADTLLPSPDLPAQVAIAGVRGEFAPDVAEHALALMLAHTRRLAQLAEHQRTRTWEPTSRPTLAGQTLTILGFGAVGQHLAHVAGALAMQVRAVSRTGDAHGQDVQVVPITQLGTAIGDAAFLVIALPLTPLTRNLFDRQVIARLRRDAYVINVARGGIVDENALADALSAGRLAGAALDVFAAEPLPSDSPMWTTPRLTITPHVAGLGDAYIERCIDALLVNVGALDAGTPLRGLVNRDAGY